MICKYLTVEQVLKLHQSVVERFGGSLGVRDRGGLESAVYRCQQTFDSEDLYPDLFSKAAALLLMPENHTPKKLFVFGSCSLYEAPTGLYLWSSANADKTFEEENDHTNQDQTRKKQPKIIQSLRPKFYDHFHIIASIWIFFTQLFNSTVFISVHIPTVV